MGGYGGMYGLNGIIDNVMLFDRSLTEEEIDALYNNGNGVEELDVLNQIPVQYEEHISAGACPEISLILRTWSASDSCGNTASASQSINVLASNPPTIDVPEDLILSCDASYEPDIAGVAVAEDGCGNSMTVSYSDVINHSLGHVTTTVSRTWIAMDICGNAVSDIQTISLLACDSDDDGMADWWETVNGLDAFSADGPNGSYRDIDVDGLTNLQEYEALTDPRKYDTDGDLVVDGCDLSPLGVLDSDGDGMPDDWERYYGLKVDYQDQLEDPDEDGVKNIQEYEYDGRPELKDSDNDGRTDGMELATGTKLKGTDDLNYMPLLVDFEPNETADDAKIYADDPQAGSQFGWRVDISGDYCVVGSYSHPAEVFRLGDHVAEGILAPPGAIPASFGSAVAIDGDTVLVSAAEVIHDTCRVYIFDRSGRNWNLTQTILPPEPCTSNFGRAVDIEADTMVISASSPGRVYVYQRQAGQWIHQETLAPPEGVESYDFGHSLCLRGDILVVGSHREDVAAAGSGAVYVFSRNADTWSLNQKLTPSNGGYNDMFGFSLDTRNDLIAVGALGARKAYLFRKINDVWTEEGIIEPSLGFPTVNGPEFGGRVAIHPSETLYVSWSYSPLTTLGGAIDFPPLFPWQTSDAGLMIYRKTTESWQPHGILRPPDPQLNYMYSLAVSKDAILVGQPYDGDYASNAGAVVDLYALLCAKGFELGSLSGQNQWGASSGVVVQDEVVYSGDLAICLSAQSSAAYATHPISGGESYDIVYEDLRQILPRWTGSQPPLLPEMPAMYYLDATGKLVVRDGDVWLTLDNNEVLPGKWVYVVVRYDYPAQKWSLWLNGTQVVNNLNFARSQSYMSSVMILGIPSGNTYCDAVHADGDADEDGMPDWWELENGITNPDGDSDGDGLSDKQEYFTGTDPKDSDTDDDGMTDGQEQALCGGDCDPTIPAEFILDGEGGARGRVIRKFGNIRVPQGTKEVPIRVVVFSREWPYWTGQQSDYDDEVSVKIMKAGQPVWENSFSVNELDSKFAEGDYPGGNYLAWEGKADFTTLAESGESYFNLEATAKNVSDSQLGSGVAILCGDVLKVDMTAYRPQTEGPGYDSPFQKHEIPDDTEVSLGAGIRINGDTEAAAAENDLIEVELEVSPFPVPSGVTYVLKRSSSSIKVWDNKNMSGSVLLDSDAEEITISSSPMSIWVENPSGGNADLELVARSGTADVCSDKIHFYPFTSVVVFFEGEGRNPYDPPTTGDLFQDLKGVGISTMALNLYLDGYDVHNYVDSPSSVGFDEIKSAVTKRDVDHVALIGYSHGGGSVYDVSVDLDADPTTFNLDFTAYLDAVAQPLANPETHRPVNTAFHVNYYQEIQPGETPFQGAASLPAGAGYEDNVDQPTATESHLTIDDETSIQTAIINYLKSKVDP